MKRDQGHVKSYKIDPEMVAISLPDQALLEDYEDFVYDKSAGTDVMLHIVDTGADLRNDDVRLLSFPLRNQSCTGLNIFYRSFRLSFGLMSDGFTPQVPLLRMSRKMTSRA